MRISDWSSDVCSSDLAPADDAFAQRGSGHEGGAVEAAGHLAGRVERWDRLAVDVENLHGAVDGDAAIGGDDGAGGGIGVERRLGDLAEVARSEEHQSELQSLMRNSYAVCCMHNKKHK